MLLMSSLSSQELVYKKFCVLSGAFSVTKLPLQPHTQADP